MSAPTQIDDRLDAALFACTSDFRTPAMVNSLREAARGHHPFGDPRLTPILMQEARKPQRFSIELAEITLIMQPLVGRIIDDAVVKAREVLGPHYDPYAEEGTPARRLPVRD